MKRKAKSVSPLKTKTASVPPVRWDLRLYVAGPTSKSIAAFRNLEELCENHLADRYHIEVVDLRKTPQLAKGDQILALPALVRHLPRPIRKVVGDLSNAEKVLVGLDLRMRDAKPFTPRKAEKDAG